MENYYIPMTVVEVVRKYELADVDKTYEDVYGRRVDISLDELMQRKVKSLHINFPTNKAVITII